MAPNPITRKQGDLNPLAELIEDIQLGDANFAADGGAASQEHIFPFNGDWKTVLYTLRNILGFHVAGGGRILRQLPKRHPLFSNLWASRLSGCRGRGYIPGNVSTGWGTMSNWSYIVATVQYSSVQYGMYSDEDLAKPGGLREWDRFVEKRIRPRLRYITSEKARYQFGPLVAPPAFAPSGVDNPNNIIKTGIAQPVAESTVEWTWKMVPRGFVLNSAGIPDNILKCVGKVNSAVFPPNASGYPAGTLLLEEPSIEPAPAPLPPNQLFGASGDIDGYVEVKLPFRYFDPPPAPGQPYRGHLLYPHPSNQTVWWPIQDVDTGALRFDQTDYTTIFRQVGT